MPHKERLNFTMAKYTCFVLFGFLVLLCLLTKDASSQTCQFDVTGTSAAERWCAAVGTKMSEGVRCSRWLNG